MQLYLRLKNRDRTVFITADTADSGRKLKTKLSELLGEKVERLKIWYSQVTAEGNEYVQLEDDLLLADKGLRDDNLVLAFTVGDEKVLVPDLSKPAAEVKK
jgi:hypothetical protein